MRVVIYLRISVRAVVVCVSICVDCESLFVLSPKMRLDTNTDHPNITTALRWNDTIDLETLVKYTTIESLCDTKQYLQNKQT